MSLGFSRFGPGDGLQAPLPRGVGHNWGHVHADLQGAARPLPAGNCHRLPPVPPRAFPLPRSAPEAGVPGGGGNAQVNLSPQLSVAHAAMFPYGRRPNRERSPTVFNTAF